MNEYNIPNMNTPGQNTPSPSQFNSVSGQTGMGSGSLLSGASNSIATSAPSVEEFSVRCQKILAVAKQLYQGNPDWVTFFREVLGVDGAARSVFPSQQEFITFEKSPEFAEIQNLVNGLRNRKISPSTINEPTRVITVRLPESLHEALKAEANDHNTSMNKLCISKLLQVLVENPKNQGAANRGGMSSPANFRSTYSPATTPVGAQTQSPYRNP